MRFLSQKRGFSLLELMIVISLMAILAAVVLPSFKPMLERAEGEGLVQALSQALEVARGEAVLLGEPVRLYPAKGGHWEQGALLVVRERVLRVFQWPLRRGVLQWQAFPVNKPYLQFMPDGSTGEQDGHFSYLKEGRVQWRIVISKAGRWRIEH